MDNQDNKNLIESAQGSVTDNYANGLSMDTVGVLINNLTPATNAGAQGVALDSLAGDDVTLFVLVGDESSSMGYNRQAVIDARNEQLDALTASKAADSILMSTLLFNTTVTLVHSYVELSKATRFDDTVYQPSGSTALYDAVLDTITSVVAYAQSLRNAGVRVKIVVVVITDGEDNSSTHTAAQVKAVIQDLIRQEIYTFAMVAFGVQGKPIADAMGIPAANVMDQTADAHSIRLALDTVSKSVIRASQTMIGAPTQGFFN